MSEENGRTDLTWRELLDEGGARLSEAGVPDAGTDAWYLMEAAFGIDRVHYYLDQNRPIHAERLEKGYGRYQEMLQKRAERIPLQQILGMQDFMGMTFSVDENVLIPRQDTETLVERLLSAEALQLPQQHRSLMRMMKKLHRQSLLSSFSTCSPHCSSRHLVHCLDFQPKAGKPSVSLPELRSTIPLP